MGGPCLDSSGGERGLEEELTNDYDVLEGSVQNQLDSVFCAGIEIGEPD